MLRFEWDPGKNEANRKKHRIGFETAQLAFEDPCCITFSDWVAHGEERWRAIGSIENAIILVVVHTHREEGAEEVIRIISARRATRHERKLYAQAIG